MGAVPETAHYLGEGGVPWEFDLPLTEVLQEKVTKGYLRRINADGSQYIEPVDAPVDDSGPPPPTPPVEQPPALNAPKAEWVGHAVRVGGMAPGDAEGLTKQDLIDKFGTPPS